MSRPLPLKGIRVLNFGWVWAGPIVGQTLGFLGAEVLKVESRVRLDPMRQVPPFHGGTYDPDRSMSNHACWAGNGSVSLNLKEPEALRLVHRLVAISDVVVENFSPDVMQRLGLGYESLRTIRPDIIMFSMPAAGLSGPMKDVRTYGTTLTALTGLDSITGYKGQAPSPVENAFTDPFAGIFGAFAILAALRDRTNTGHGQHIDFSQQEAVMQMIGPAYMDYVLNGAVARPKGNEHPLDAAAPHGVFRCAGDDRWISIVVATDDEWKALLEFMGRPSELATPEFERLSGRLERIDELHRAVESWTRSFDDRDLAALLQERGIAAAPVSSMVDLARDPQFVARKTFVQVRHPLGFDETIYGGYVKLSRTKPEVRPGPALGQDNRYVFEDLLGMTSGELADLVERRIVF